MKSFSNGPVFINKCRTAVTVCNLCSMFLAIFNYTAGNINAIVRQGYSVQIISLYTSELLL